MLDKIIFDINEELKKIPELPGIYIMKDADGKVIYVGKSKTLKNRVRSYFQASNAEMPKHKVMVPQIKSFEYIVTDNEVEALILECNLIKKHRPRYNILLKDDKTYPYIKFTLQEPYPRIFMVRKFIKDDAKYYGPYPTGYSVFEVLDLIRQLWPLRMCEKPMSLEGRKTRPCLNYHMGLCKAPCDGSISKEDYDKMTSEILRFLNGKHGDIVKKLESEMNIAAENLEFERAAKIRNQIFAVNKLEYRQKMEKISGDNRDIVAFAKLNDEAMAQLFYMRDGKMTGREHYMITGVSAMSDGEIMNAFILQFYSKKPDIPHEIVLQTDIADREAVEELLTTQRGAKVMLTIPKIGEKVKLVALAMQNAEIALERYGDIEKREWNRTQGALKEIVNALKIQDISFHRIEAYDISNIQGFESVGSMIVFEDGKKNPREYRKFKIKSVQGADDYASIEEVLTRRFTRFLTEQNDTEKAKKFSELPDILFIDGGKGQVSSAEAVLNALQIQIPVCGMVKDDKHRTKGLLYKDEEISLPKTSEGFKLLTRIQDEVHRFAVEYHRKLREKAMVKSELDDIKGIGAARKKSLMKHFGSVEKMKKASFDEILAVDSMSKTSAEAVYNFLHNDKK